MLKTGRLEGELYYGRQLLFGQLFNNLQWAALLTSLIQHDEVSFQI